MPDEDPESGVPSDGPTVAPTDSVPAPLTPTPSADIEAIVDAFIVLNRSASDQDWETR
jgi:hypothetical protein